jgi:hypothetical protein
MGSGRVPTRTRVTLFPTIVRGFAGPGRPLALFLVLVAGPVAVEAVPLIGRP